VGLELELYVRVGRPTWLESPELNAEDRRERRAVARAAAQADRGVPRGLEEGGAQTRVARVGEPQHFRARRRPDRAYFAVVAARSRTRSATSTRIPVQSSAARTRPSPARS
jgi:hypothetical protein